jgi:hypothetical protein
MTIRIIIACFQINGVYKVFYLKWWIDKFLAKLKMFSSPAKTATAKMTN